MAGGAAEVSSGLISGWISLRETSSLYESAGYYPEAAGWMYSASAISHGAQGLLLSVGILGLYAALTKRSSWLRVVAGAGAGVVLLAGLALGVGTVYELSAQPAYYSSVNLPSAISLAGWYGQPVGVTLLGVAALWTRGLGYWRVLPLIVGFLRSPLAYLLLFALFLGPDAFGRAMDSRQIVVSTVLFAAPEVLAGLGWVAVGLALLGVQSREAACLTRERRETERENGRKARDLYERAFGAGDLSAVDEIGAPYVLDLRNGSCGPEAFKRTILGLRRTFPDLSVSVEERTAEGDVVTTRCSFSGTDRGGLLWYPPTNRHAAFSVTYTDRFSDGKLAEHDGEADTERLLAQLGLPDEND